MNCTRGRLVNMQKLAFAEIRNRYKEKYKKRLGSTNDVLKKRLEGYRTCQDGRQYFIKVQDKQKECEEIVDSLILHNRVLHEPDVIKKYELLIDTIPEQVRLKFPDTLERHKGYIQHLINHRKDKRTQVVRSFRALETMLPLMDKEITEYSDEELSELIKDKSFTVAQKQYAVWFLKYIYNKEPDRFKFNVEMSMLRRETIRVEEDFYTPEE